MTAEPELSLHNGEITFYQYLEHKRAELDLSKPCILWKETSEVDRAKGLTPRMRTYCRLHGLDGIPDLDIVWRKPKINYIWNIGKNKNKIVISEAKNDKQSI